MLLQFFAPDEDAAHLSSEERSGSRGGYAVDNNHDKRLTVYCSLPTSAAFGGVALFAVIFYASGIPRVQSDILQVWTWSLLWKIGIRPLTTTQHVPYFGKKYFVHEIPASDNVSLVVFPLYIIEIIANP